MADSEQLAILKKGSDIWNTWRKEHPLAKVDLSEAQIDQAKLVWTDLSGADLRGMCLVEADLTGANMRSSDLRGAQLRHANLLFANLSGVHLEGSDLRFSRMSATNLSGANFSSAMLAETVFADLDLRGAMGLERCAHLGPSIVDFRTLAKSWPLPPSFLRGCGLPDTLIEYLPSLLNQPVQFYSCFISHSTKDQKFAERLYNELQGKGVRCWFAPHDMQGGKKVHEQIDEAIRVYDRLLLILSEDSIHSDWVQIEISKALKREKREERRMLFPIGLVPFKVLEEWECYNSIVGDLAEEIRQYYIPDFSNWKSDHDSYQQALERLLHDLQAKTEATEA
jgi:hypothetical protein